jgi:hypothetical protein|tara:strand:+ start:76 stop:744 length:669 start_codon:yes stop_codon:yes gene_type:complete
MREYILEKINNTPKFINLNGVDVEINDELPENFNVRSIFKAIEQKIPSHFFVNLNKIRIENDEEFRKRDINALYRDNQFIISPKQKNENDLIDDIVHEFAHHVETLFTEEIYSDEKIKNEFIRKRQEMKFEIQSEGYWVGDYDFDQLKFDERFDTFLYSRLGPNMLRMVTTGLFIRPYASVSLREYFATGFEAYYLGKQNSLEKISPMLFDKIDELNNKNQY